MIDNNDARYAHKWLKNDYMEISNSQWEIVWLHKNINYRTNNQSNTGWLYFLGVVYSVFGVYLKIESNVG